MTKHEYYNQIFPRKFPNLVSNSLLTLTKAVQVNGKIYFIGAQNCSKFRKLKETSRAKLAKQRGGHLKNKMIHHAHHWKASCGKSHSKEHEMADSIPWDFAKCCFHTAPRR